MPHLDVNTLSEYAAGGIGAVISALGASVSLKVYDGAGVEKGTGTLSNPWATQNGAEFMVNALTAFQVTSTGTPDSNWYLRFEGAGRWVRGSFGLVSSSQEFLWSLANWIAGTPGRIGTITVTSPASSVQVSWTAPTQNTDGSALTGDDAIARYRVEWGTVIDGAFGVFINSKSVTSPATSTQISDLAAGTYAFRVTAIAVDGEESTPHFLGTKVVA